ncbi:hypothetical protein Pmani_004197 [Petrolisthes manimaculis]|uniref:Uncharacterized protein n=1 Tax=Petrolisthes manimaculis TaxID=1843537 RepID=A0AAE1QF74_9EUCA|nr:hypothetical protein Pmani_004197 [Petrolisthes manimaculis]
MLHKVVLVALVASVVADKRPRYDPDPYDPDRYDPDPYDPDRYDPDSYEPDRYNPDPYEPDRYDPDPYDPDRYDPDSYEPDRYNPDPYDPDSYEPDPYDHSDEYDHSHEDYPKYHFDWKVKDHYNDFGHKEYRDGYDTEGEYYVLLPDGRRQTVTYYVKKGSGFVADVKYDPKDPIYPSSGEYRKYKPTYDSDEYKPPHPKRPTYPSREYNR